MTAAQNKKYWRLWGAVSRECKRAVVALPDRKELHRQALAGCQRGAEGQPCGKCAERLANAEAVSHTECDNHWTDLIYGVLLAWSKPGDLHAQMRQEEQPLIRLRHRVRELAAGNEGLVAKLLHDRFKWPVWLRQHYAAEAGLRVDQCPAVIVAEYRDSSLKVAVDDLNETELVQLRDTLCRLQPAKPRDPKPKTQNPTVLAEQALADCPY